MIRDSLARATPWILALYVSALFLPAFLSSGPLLYTDQPLWAAVAHTWRAEVIPDQAWFTPSVSDRADAGLVLGQVYSLAIWLPWILSSLFSPGTAVKLATFGSALFYVGAVYLLARQVASRAISALAAAVLLAHGFGEMTAGMWYQYVALASALIVWVICERARVLWRSSLLAAAAAAMALCAYAHPVGLLAAALIYASHLGLLFREDRWRPGPRLAAAVGAGVAALLLAMPQLQGYLSLAPDLSTGAPSSPGGAQVSINPGRLLQGMSGGLTGVDVAIACASGVLLCYGVYGLWRTRRLGLLLPALMMLGGGLLLAMRGPVQYEGAGQYGDFAGHFGKRFLVLWQLALVLLAAGGLQHLVRCLAGTGWPRKAGVAALAALWVAPALRPAKNLLLDDAPNLVTLGGAKVEAAATELWSWLDAHADPARGRVYFENTGHDYDWNATPEPLANWSHFLALSSIFASIDQVNGWCNWVGPFGLRHGARASGSLFGLPAHRLDAALVNDEMRILNVRLLVAHSPELIAWLTRNPDTERVARLKGFSVFENRSFEPALGYQVESGEPLAVTRHSPSLLELSAEGPAGSWVHVALAYAKNWRASCEGRPVPLVNHHELIRLQLPESGQQTIQLRFDASKRVPSLALLAGLLLVARWMLSGRGAPLRAACARSRS